MVKHRGSIAYEDTSKNNSTTESSSFRERELQTRNHEVNVMIDRHNGLLEKINEFSGYDKEGQLIFTHSEDERARLQRQADGLADSIEYQAMVGIKAVEKAEAEDDQRVADLQSQLDRQKQVEARADEIVLQRQAETMASLKIQQGE